MSLPRKIGRISSADLESLRINSSLVAELIIKAELNPVRIPLYILIFQSANGVPLKVIFSFILCSIDESITHASEVKKAVWQPDCLVYTLLKTIQGGANYGLRIY